jgi:hypothetical protein
VVNAFNFFVFRHDVWTAGHGDKFFTGQDLQRGLQMHSSGRGVDHDAVIAQTVHAPGILGGGAAAENADATANVRKSLATAIRPLVQFDLSRIFDVA